jgi:hypothetical protein
MRMVVPFRFEKPRKALSTKFGQRLILLWPFGETNAAAMRTAPDAATASPHRRATVRQ